MPLSNQTKTQQTQAPQRPANRRIVLLLLGMLPVIAGALYLNHVSARWGPEADRKVQAARKQAIEQAFADLAKQASEQPNSPQIQSQYAKALVDRNEFVAAMIPAEHAVAAAPKDSDALLLLAMIYSTLGYRTRALECYQESLRVAPTNMEAMQRLADYLHAMGDRKGAELVYLQAQKCAPDAPGPRLSLASLYLEEKRADDALNVLDPIVKNLQTAPPAALYLAGKACAPLGKTQRAAELLREAIRRQPDFADAYHELGSSLCNQADFKQGIPMLQKAVSLAPNDSSSRYALGSAFFNDYAEPDRLKSAKEAFAAALERNPQDDWAHYYYGYTLEQMGELQAAIREYDRALEISPKFDSAWYRKGAVYTALGNGKEAKRCYLIFDSRSKNAINEVHGRRRENSIVDTAEEHYKRGLALERQGEKQKAIDDFQLALHLNPQYAPARRALQDLGGR